MRRLARFCLSAVVAAALVAAGISACRQPEPQRPLRRTLRLTTGTPGARFYPLGQALARVYAASLPDTDIVTLDSAGSIANVDGLERGSADIGLSYADVAYMAYAGHLDPARKQASGLRAIAVLELAPVHLVVRAGSAIARAADLRGKRVAVGPTGSGSALTARIVLDALGIGEAGVRVESLKYNDAAARLLAGTIDALFVTGSDPVESVRATTIAGARILPLAGSEIEKLRHDYAFFRPTVIRGGTYPGHPQPVATIGVDNVLLCRRDLDEATVHDLTRQLFLHLASTPLLISMDLEQAPATPIPLHEGAIRYYRERELSR